jgi:hypothetical protein
MAIGWLVTRDQFEVSDEGITHGPTGYNFKPYPRSPTDGTVNRGQLGNELPTGEYYRLDDVEDMAKRLWWEYLARIW